MLSVPFPPCLKHSLDLLAANELVHLPVLTLAIRIAVLASLAPSTEHHLLLGTSAMSTDLALLGSLHTRHVGFDVLDECLIAGSGMHSKWRWNVQHVWVDAIGGRIGLIAKSSNVSSAFDRQ